MEFGIAASEPVSHGLWIDDPTRTVLNKGYFRSLADCNVDSIAIMIDRCDLAWKSTWQYAHLDKLLELADKPAIETILTTWPYPNKEQIDKMAAEMSIIMGIGPIVAWEVDLEFNWKNKHVRGFKRTADKGGLDLAGDYLVKKIREVCSQYNARFEVTSFTQHTENGPKADVAPHCDCLLVQAYSVRRRPGVKKPISYEHTYGPGNMQTFTLDRSLLIPGMDDGKPELGCGLAAWSQRWPGVDPEEAMAHAYDAARDYPVVAVRWWSSKHVIGVKKNPYAHKFMEKLRFNPPEK